jgi:organic radical activating enzyme
VRRLALPALPRRLSDVKVDFLLKSLPKLLEQVRLFGAWQVGFTGGEPHLHPQFAELVEMVSQVGFTWKVARTQLSEQEMGGW